MKIVCVGSPMVDAIAHVEQGFLTKHGLESDRAHVGSVKGLLEELDGVRYEIGGSITNTARTIKWVARDGCEVVFLGAVGSDGRADFLEKQLEEEGVQCGFKMLDGDTAMCAVLLEGRNRTLITDLGITNTFSDEDLRNRSIWEQLEEADWIYFSAFFLNLSAKCVDSILELCKSKQKKIAFNLGAPFLCGKYSDKIMEIITAANIIFSNETEFLALSQTHSKTDNIKGFAIQQATSHPNQLIAITRSDKPAFLIDQSGTIQEFPIATISDMVTTNGAGDAFAGGFLARHLLGSTPQECMGYGLWAARQMVRGCAFNANKTFPRDD